VTDIRFNKVIPVSDNTKLIVKSWNSWLGQLSQYTDNQLSVEVPPDGAGLNDSSGAETAVIRPNLTSQGAQQLYQRCLNSLNEQNTRVEITMPGELTLRPGDVMSVVGSNTDFDSHYTIKSIRRQYSSTAGFVQHIQGFLTIASSNPSQDTAIV
jgi:hypothetical protein